MSEYENFEPTEEINRIIQGENIQALPSIYEKKDKTNVVTEGTALVASANARTLPTRRVGRFEMLEVLERSLSRTVLNFNNPSQRAFTAMRELSDFVNMATTGATPKIAGEHRDLLPVGHPLSNKEHNFSTEELAQARAEWMSADPRIAEEFRPMVATAFVTPEDSVEREYLIAKLEATPANQVPRDVILGLTAGIDPYGGGNSFLARSARARAQRRDRKGRFAWMGGGAKVWLGKVFDAVSSLFRFAGYDSKTDSFDLEGIPGSPYFGKIVSIPASKVEAIKAILPEIPGLALPKSKSVSKNLIVDPASLVIKDAPTGWTKVSSENGVDTFRSADGWIATRYPNSASAPNEPSITRVRGANDDKSVDPDLPVYHIAKGSSDGTVVDKPFALTQGWGDAQALISRYDKKTTPSGKKKKIGPIAKQKFIKGWTKGEGGYIPGKWNVYTEVSDRAGGKDFYTDPSGRYVAVKLATPPATWQVGAEQYKQTEDERTRRQVLESGLPIHTFDGAKDWDGNVDNLYRLERIKSDGKRELLGFYQDLEDIEKDTEIPPTEDKPQEFYESVIADTLQNGGNTIDFVDGNWPEDGYIVAHEADILQQDGTLGKREEIYTPEEFADPIEGPKILRAFVLKNQDKLSQQGFYLGTWLDTVKVTDEKGNVVDEREMVYLDVSEYEADFDKAFDMAEARKEIAIYGVATYDKDGNKGTSLYVADEKRRREIVRKTPVFDEKEAKRVMDEADKIMKEEDKWFSDNRLEVQKTRVTFWKDEGNESFPNPELQKDYPEIYRRLKRRFDAEKSRRSVFQNYIRSIFDMSDGMDPGGRNDGLSGESLRTRDNYVGRDSETLKMNKALRDGGEVTSKVQKMDTLVKKSKVKDDTQFFRGAWLDPELVKDMGVGDMFFDRAFQSMGLKESTASSYLDFREKDFPNKSRVIFRLLLPKGMNAIHVGDDEVIARRNTKMRIIRKSELDGTTYFDVDVEPQTKEEIDARIQGRVPRPEQSEDGTSSSELPGNDGGGADGLGDGGPLPINYGPKPTGERPDEGIISFDPVDEVPNSPKNAGGMTSNTWWAWEKGPDGNQFIDYMRQQVCRLVGLPVPQTDFDKGKGSHFMLQRGWGSPSEKSIRGMIDAIKNSRPQPTLYRGIGDNSQSNVEVQKLRIVQEGDVLDMPLASTTRSAGVAAWYASDRGRGGVPIILKIKEGANGVSVPKKGSFYPQDYETVVNGKFKVLSNQTIVAPVWSRDYVTFYTNGFTSEPDGRPILEGVISRELEDKIQKELETNPDSDLSKFNTDRLKFTNDRSRSTFENGGSRHPISVWQLSEPKKIQVIELEQEKVYDIDGNKPESKDQQPETYENVESSSAEKSQADTGNSPLQSPIDGIMVSYAPRNIEDQREQAPRVTDPNLAIWAALPFDLGQSQNEIIDRAEKMGVPPERILDFYAQILKDGVANSVLKKLQDIDDKEFIKLANDLGKFTKLSEEVDWSEPKKLQKINLYTLNKRGEVYQDPKEFTDIFRWARTNPEFDKKHRKLTDKINSTGEINLEEAKLILDAYNEAGKLGPLTLWEKLMLPDTNDRKFLDALRYTIVSSMVGQWASTSNGSDIMSLSIQEVAKREFGIKGSADWNRGIGLELAVEDVAKNNRNLIGRFLRAQYDLTQEYFKKKGISKITLFRGVKDFVSHDVTQSTFPSEQGYTVSIRLRPMSSWSTAEGVAIRFARGNGGKIFRKEYDVKDIIAFPGTGVGCYDEKEMVVLGGVVDSVDVGDYSPLNIDDVIKFPSSAPSAITYKQEPALDFMLNYAPIRRDFRELTDEERAEISRHNPPTAIWVPIAEESTFYGKEIPSTLVNVLEQDKEAVRVGKLGGPDIGQEATIGLSRALKSGVATNLTEKLKDIDDKEFIDLAMAQGKEEINAGDKSAVESLRYQVVSDLIKSWSVTSNGDEPMSLAVQEIAKKEFGVETAANWDIDEEKQKQVDDIVKNNENLIRKFLRAQYDATQEYFKRKGITKLSLFRGVKKFDNHEMIEATFPNNGMFTATLGLRPLSSWSTSRKVAEIFANFHQQSRLFRKEFDVKDIMCFPGTGFGCLDEKEMVVIGGNTKSIDVSSARLLNPIGVVGQTPFSFEKESKNYQIVFKDDKKNPLEEPTEAGRPIGNWVNYAPVDLSKIPPDDGGDEPDPDEINIFDLENPDYSAPGFYKFEIAKNLAETDEMREVSDSEMVDLSDWFGLFSTDDIDWGEDEKKEVGSIKLLSLDQSEFGEGEWGGEYEFTNLLSDIEQNIRFGGVEPFKKGSVLKRVMDGYIAGEDPAISKEELAQFFKDYSKHFDEDITDSYLVPSVEDEQFMRLLREEVASNLVHVWAETSNGDHPMSHALQDIAKDVLGVEDSADWEDGKTQDQKDELFNAALDVKENYREALRAFVKAQYRLTQEWLEERGIEKLVVYRGIREPKGVDNKKGLVQLRPLSSWSQNQSEALKFTGGTPNQKGAMLRTVIDAKDVFSTPFTGFGCLEEDEIVVIGGKKSAEMRPVKDVWSGWYDEPKISTNNAPISNAPKPMSNTERKRLERERRKAEEAAAPSPEQIKEEMKQGQQNIAEVAQTIPESIDTLFDPSNPLNILNARNITNEITGSDINTDNLTQDEILRQKVLFMEPTKEWDDLLDKVEQSGTPFAKEIISRIKKDHAKLIEKIQRKSLDERQAQIEYDNAVRDMHNVVNNLVNNALANPSNVPNLNSFVPILMSDLDSYFGGNPSNVALSDNTNVLEMAMMSLYNTTDPDVAMRDPNFDQNDFSKMTLDLVARFRGAYTMYGSSSKTPDRNALTKQIQRIYIENLFGGVNPTDTTNTMRILAKLHYSRSVPSLIPNDAVRILSDKERVLSAKRDNLFNRKRDVTAEKAELAKKISSTTKQVLSENGLEFNHGVELSASDLNWDGVTDLTQNLTTDPVTGNKKIALQQIPDRQKAAMASELKNRNGVLDIINEALQAYPKPVAMAVRQFLIDNKSSFSFTSGTRGATAMLNLNSPDKAHDIGDITLGDVIKGMSLSGRDKESAVETTIHEMVHLIVNGMFRNQMNAIAWAKQSRETNNVAPDGKISHNFVDGNYGNVAYTPNGDYLDPKDMMRMIQYNELGAASSNYANPYIGKYGTSGGANVALGQSPFSHGELLSTLLESLLGGGLSGMFSTYANPKKVLSGTNPDGTPKYVNMDDSVFSESMLPFGVSMIVLLNELAKTRLGIA